MNKFLGVLDLDKIIHNGFNILILLSSVNTISRYFLFSSALALIFMGGFSVFPSAEAGPMGNQVTLEELGILQLAAHDLFNVNRVTSTDFENGKLDLSTLFTDMTSGNPFSLADIVKGGEPRNRENILLFSVASVIGQNYVDDVNGGATPAEARQTALNDYHTQFNAAYLSAFGESVPNSAYGCVTMTENLAFRTVHDFLPGMIRMDTALPNDVIDVSDDLFPLLDFTPPFDNPLQNANGHTGPLTFELDQLSSDLNGDFDPEFNAINIFIPPSTFIIVDLEAADQSFGVQFGTDFSFEYFMNEIASTGSYEPNYEVMNQIRSLIAKGYGQGCYVGGEMLPIEASSLILAGVQSITWLIPVLVSAVGIALVFGTRKSNI